MKKRIGYFVLFAFLSIFLVSQVIVADTTFEPLPFHAYDFDAPARASVATMRAMIASNDPEQIQQTFPDQRAVAAGFVPNTFDGWQTLAYWRGAPASPNFLMPQFGPEYARGFTALVEEMKKGSGWAYDFSAWNARYYGSTEAYGWLSSNLDNSKRFGIGLNPDRLREAAIKVWGPDALNSQSNTILPPSGVELLANENRMGGYMVTFAPGPLIGQVYPLTPVSNVVKYRTATPKDLGVNGAYSFEFGEWKVLPRSYAIRGGVGYRYPASGWWDVNVNSSVQGQLSEAFKGTSEGRWIDSDLLQTDENALYNFLITVIPDLPRSPLWISLSSSTSPACKLTLASWSTLTAVEGENVVLNVQGNNCNGKTVSFEIWEKDLTSADDAISIGVGSVVFSGNSAVVSWISEWQDDGILGGDPEYYFIATVVGTNEKLSSEFLPVTKNILPPRNSCGDRICNGEETSQSCLRDCPTHRCGDNICNDDETSASCSSDCLSSPTITFFAVPISIRAGQSSTLTWSSPNANRCDASGGWDANRIWTRGSQVVTPTKTTTYILTCRNSEGSSSQPVTVGVSTTTPPDTDERPTPQTPACTDSDGGIDYDVKGTTTFDRYEGDYPVVVNSETDYCFNENLEVSTTGQSVHEFFCEDSLSASSINYDCPNSCVDGACVQTILLPGTLAVGSWIQLSGNTHVRENPNTLSVVLTTQLSGARGKISEGPVSADGLTWWNVDYETDKDGWSRSTLMIKIARPELT